MANNIVLLDTSMLIDYFRKTDKYNAAWISLVRKGHKFVISTLTKYEIYSGATQNQLSFWDSIFETIPVIPFDEDCVDAAIYINSELKKKRKQIAIANLFIASTAITHKLPIATLNKQHFERIDELTILNNTHRPLRSRASPLAWWFSRAYNHTMQSYGSRGN